MSNKLAIVGLGLSMIISLTLIFGFWLPYIKRTQKAYHEAIQETETASEAVEVAKENLAQALANEPWTLEEIYTWIDYHVSIGDIDESTGEWLKDRVAEIRSS